MRCPRCGTESPGGLCSSCQTPQTEAATAALTASVDEYPTGGSTRITPGDTARVTRAGIGAARDDDTDTSTSAFPLVDRPVRPAAPAARPNNAAPAASALDSSTDHGPLTPGQAFGPRYHIIRILGMGGMGAVYHAWDAELGVAVAIKIIRPEIMADPGTAAEVERRFKRELLLARQVTHKNVVRIHDLGEIRGIKYITMSFVERHRPGHAAQERGDAEGLGRDAGGPLGRVGARGRARGRRRAPRPQARQPHARRRWRGADHGLRDRAVERGSGHGGDGGGSSRASPHGHDRRRDGRDGSGRRRDGRVHGARTGQGASSGPARRHLFVRSDSLRPARRPRAPRAGTERDRRAQGPDGACARASPLLRSGDPGSARCAHLAVSRTRPRQALSDDHRARSGSQPPRRHRRADPGQARRGHADAGGRGHAGASPCSGAAGGTRAR